MQDIKNWAVFVLQTLEKLGFEMVPGGLNMFQRPWGGNEQGWGINFVEPEVWRDNTLLVSHSSDFASFNTERKCVELERLERHYGERSRQILFLHWEHNMADFYQGPINLCWWSTHNYFTCLDMRAIEHQWLPELRWPRAHNWQCLNGRIQGSRMRAAHLLKDIPGGYLSLGDEIPLREYPYSTYFNTENEDNFVRLMYVYGDSYVNIVTETKYHEATGIITEKTLQACAAEQIPIIIGHPGAVDHARAMGLDMFEDVVDLSYADLPNETRVDEAIRRNMDLIMGRVDLSPYRSRLQRQREYVIHQLPEVMEQRFEVYARDLARRLLPAQHGHEPI